MREDDVRASALQYVRKISGFNKPSAANQAAYARAVDGVAAVSQALLDALVTAGPPRKGKPEVNREHVQDAAGLGLGD